MSFWIVAAFGLRGVARLIEGRLILLSQKVAVLRRFALTSDLIACGLVIEESSGDGQLDSRE